MRDGLSLWVSKGRQQGCLPRAAHSGAGAGHGGRCRLRWCLSRLRWCLSRQRCLFAPWSQGDVAEPEKPVRGRGCSSQRTDTRFWPHAGNGSSAAEPGCAQTPPLMAGELCPALNRASDRAILNLFAPTPQPRCPPRAQGWLSLHRDLNPKTAPHVSAHMQEALKGCAGARAGGTRTAGHGTEEEEGGKGGAWVWVCVPGVWKTHTEARTERQACRDTRAHTQTQAHTQRHRRAHTQAHTHRHRRTHTDTQNCSAKQL